MPARRDGGKPRIDVGRRSFPSFVDYDGDGDLDLVAEICAASPLPVNVINRGTLAVEVEGTRDGRLETLDWPALRFVFPPYQVGPYADGTQTVDVPAEVLRPHIAPEYAGLFAD